MEGVTQPRQIIPGETYLITRRASQRAYLLRPDAETTAIFDYCLAEAAARHGIGLIAWTAMSNHYHAVVHDPKGRLPAFLEHFHKMVAKAMNARWERFENFWSSDECCVTRLIANNDIFEKILYVLCNPVAADLVERIQDWPGSSSLGHFDGKTTKHRRPKHYFANNGVMPEVVTLRATLPSRITKHESAASFWQRVRKALAGRVETLRETRVRAKRRILGRKAVMRISHTDTPKSDTIRRGLRPCIACLDEERRKQELKALQAFRMAYAAARVRWSKGERRTIFPYGTYRLLEHGVRCAEPPSPN